MVFAPVSWRLGITEPSVGDTASSGESDFAVCHHDFAMVTGVDIPWFEECPAIVKSQLHAGAFHGFNMVFTNSAATELIEDQVHFDSGPGAFAKCLGEMVGCQAFDVSICLEGDAMLGFLDCLEHGRIETITVDEGFDVVAFCPCNSSGFVDCLPEGGVVCCGCVINRLASSNPNTRRAR